MRAFRWLSEWFGRLDPRERRVVAAGALVSGMALLIVRGVLPLARRWAAREAEVTVKAEQIARLEAAARDEPALRRALSELRDGRTTATRLIEGSTVSLAASNLQVLLTRYAEQSGVALERVELGGSETPGAGAAGLPTLAVQLVGRAELAGLVDLLLYLQNSEKLLVVDELRVTATGTDPAAQLLWSLRVRGFYGGPGATS